METTDNRPAFAQLVERLRKTKGWNRKQLAEKAGLHPSHISLIEGAGRVGVRPATLEKLATALSVTKGELLGEVDHSPETSDLEPYRLAIEAAQDYGLTPEKLSQLIISTASVFGDDRPSVAPLNAGPQADRQP